MKKAREKITETNSIGYGCLATGRCYRWTRAEDGTYLVRGPGLSRNHQPRGRHPVWKLIKDWEKRRGLV